MHRELFALLNASDKDSPILPTDYGFSQQSSGYKQVRAKLSMKKPRAWKWTPFLNQARTDQLNLYHWTRVTDQSEAPKEYRFAKLNVKLDNIIPKYNQTDYELFLKCDNWTREETDHLMDLCSRFDLRFIVMHDRWDRQRHPNIKSVEDMKDRFYTVHNLLVKARLALGEDPKFKSYDVETEKKRKEQLINLYNRTPEQIKEEAELLSELKKIEIRKKERERKQQDLQKIMDAAEKSSEAKRAETHQQNSGRPIGSGTRGVPGRRPGSGRGSGRPSRDSSTPASASTPHVSNYCSSNLLEASTAGVKFPDLKTSGATLRSQRMKLPASVGAKKIKAIEQMLQELNLEQHPMPTDAICQNFNELRSDLVLLYELKVAITNCDIEIQTLKHQFEASQPGATLDFPNSITPTSSVMSETDPRREISDVIDISNAAGTPGRKRKAALEQGNLLRKLKKT